MGVNFYQQDRKIDQMAILEKFKKQIVQDLARHMIEENEPRDQMWSRLKDEYGLDCKLLW